MKNKKKYGKQVGQWFDGKRKRAWAPEMPMDKYKFEEEAGSITVKDSSLGFTELPDTFLEWPPDAEPNLITSKVNGNVHAPCLDLDLPVKLIPSQTPGNYHLYIDTNVHWDDYQELLHALHKCGIIQKGYLDTSIKRGYTALRPPSL